ncbi:MAG TPA: hypothetical protein VH744_14665, partial [Terriglobales bacterium]
MSGDSRNCGDVIMPAIARRAEQDGAKFYWHLGDLRAIYDFDEDMQAEWRANKQKLNILKYLEQAWDDFEIRQVRPFGEIPFLIGIGNHETIPRKDRCQFAERFASWLKDPILEHPVTASPPATVKPTGTTGPPGGEKCPDKCDEVQPT